MGFLRLSHHLRMDSKGRLSVLSGNSVHSGCWLPPLRCLWNAVVLTTGCCLHAWGKGPAMVWAVPVMLALAGATPGVWSLHQHRSAALPSWVLVHIHCVTAIRYPTSLRATD